MQDPVFIQYPIPFPETHTEGEKINILIKTHMMHREFRIYFQYQRIFLYFKRIIVLICITIPSFNVHFTHFSAGLNKNDIFFGSLLEL